jgi:hypothetical protein
MNDVVGIRMVDCLLSKGAPRSAVYREGMLSVFRFRRTGRAIPHPYEMGTVEADAYYAGVERGHYEWAKVLGA